VNRTEADPIDVLVLTDVPLPLPVDETLLAADLTPTPNELMLGADAAAAYPGLFSSADAARKALGRVSLSPRFGTKRDSTLLIRDRPEPLRERENCLRRVDYQVLGSGRRRSVAWYDPAVVPDPAATLRKLLGPLSWYHEAEATEIRLQSQPAPDGSALPPFSLADDTPLTDIGGPSS
jgi:hypothetical protein